MKRKILVLLTALILFVPRTASSIEATREVLDNGLVLLYSPMHHLPVVSLSLLIKVSVMDEPADRAGLANLVAELLTEGTETFTAEQFSEEVDFLGIELSVSQQRDYLMITLKSLKKNLPRAVELLAEMLLRPAFRQNEIDRTKALIIDSLKQAEEEPSFVAMRALRKAVYGDHPYGRVLEGDIQSIKRITREDIVEFYKTYYRPNNSILAVVGDLSKEQLQGLLKRHFLQWQKAEIPTRRPLPPVELTGPEVITIDRDLTQANIKLGHLGIKRDNPDYYALTVMNYILGGGGFASRLMSRIRDDLGLAYDVHSYFTSNKFTGLFQIGVQTKNASAAEVVEIILQEMKRLQKEVVSTQELEDAKAFLTGSFPRRIDTMGKIANFLVLTEFFGLGLDYDKKYIQHIRAVTADDIKRVAQRYLHPDRAVLVVVGRMKEINLEKVFPSP